MLLLHYTTLHTTGSAILMTLSGTTTRPEVDIEKERVLYHSRAVQHDPDKRERGRLRRSGGSIEGKTQYKINLCNSHFHFRFRFHTATQQWEGREREREKEFSAWRKNKKPRVGSGYVRYRFPFSLSLPPSHSTVLYIASRLYGIFHSVSYCPLFEFPFTTVHCRPATGSSFYWMATANCRSRGSIQSSICTRTHTHSAFEPRRTTNEEERTKEEEKRKRNGKGREKKANASCSTSSVSLHAFTNPFQIFWPRFSKFSLHT